MTHRVLRIYSQGFQNMLQVIILQLDIVIIGAFWRSCEQMVKICRQRSLACEHRKCIGKICFQQIFTNEQIKDVLFCRSCMRFGQCQVFTFQCVDQILTQLCTDVWNHTAFIKPEIIEFIIFIEQSKLFAIFVVSNLFANKNIVSQNSFKTETTKSLLTNYRSSIH